MRGGESRDLYVSMTGGRLSYCTLVKCTTLREDFGGRENEKSKRVCTNVVHQYWILGSIMLRDTILHTIWQFVSHTDDNGETGRPFACWFLSP